MDSYTFRSNLKKYTEEAIKDLEEVKKINDIEQQCNKVSFDVRKHKQKFEELKQ
ncbi:9274_t:CDS:1, partial [Ambispora gerdemannii]